MQREHAYLCFHFHILARHENQKLKELVTGGPSTAGSSAVPSDSEAAEPKEEAIKEESAVRPKMETNTPQKVVQFYIQNDVLNSIHKSVIPTWQTFILNLIYLFKK